MHFKMSVKNRIATISVVDSPLVNDNTGDTVRVMFDSEWNNYATRTAVLCYNGKKTEVVFSGDTFVLPRLVNVSLLRIGITAGNIRTTTAAMLRVRDSVLSLGGPISAPTEDVYSQLIALIDSSVIENAEVNADGNLIITTANGETYDAGHVKGADGVPGADGADGAPGRDGADGAPGRDGSDANVTADNVNAAFAAATDAQKQTARENIGAAAIEGNYELVETITLAEDTANVTRTEEPGGASYNFEKVFCVIKTPPTASGSISLTMQARCETSMLTYGGLSYSPNRVGTFCAYKKNGYWWGELWSAEGLYTDPFIKAQANDHILDKAVSNYPNCTELRFYVSGAGSIPTGTIIKIYGVRA